MTSLLRSWKPVLALAVLVLIATLYLQNRDLREALRHALLSPRIERETRIIDRPVTITVPVPGGGGIVPVIVERRDGVVRATAPPIPCKDEAECRRIFGAAEQRLLVEMVLRQGVVVPVLFNNAEVNLALARDFPLSLRLVLSERGVFHALEPKGHPLKVARVVTETKVEVPRVQPLDFHFGVLTRVDSRGSVLSGVRYRNRAWGGIYEVDAGWGWPGVQWSISWVLPIR